jgi:hypothetical protein
MTEQTKEAAYGLVEKLGFPVAVAIAAGWILRNDVLLPLVAEHRAFVQQLGETQRDISLAIQEQTRLLYALQPRSERAVPVKVEVKE